jgi:hypothetical protein
MMKLVTLSGFEARSHRRHSVAAVFHLHFAETFGGLVHQDELEVCVQILSAGTIRMSAER